MFNRLFKRVRLGKSKKGFALIIVAFALPVFLAGINWIITTSKKANIDVTKYEIPYLIALEISKHYNPSKSWADQRAYLYSVGARAYNDRYYNIDKSSPFTLKSNLLIYSSRKTSNCVNQTDAFFKLCNYYRNTNNSLLDKGFTQRAELQNMPAADTVSYNSNASNISYNQYQLSGNVLAYSMPVFNENSTLLTLDFDESNGILTVKCPKLGRKAVAQFPRNDLDIILAIPTNYASGTSNNSNSSNIVDLNNLDAIRNTPIKQIAESCQGFISEMSHIRGVAVGVIPYSGKISLPPNRSGWTIRADMSKTEQVLNYPYVQQTMFYGSDGKFGGELRSNGNSNDYGTYRYWGYSDVGYPIMYRRGDITKIRNMSVYSSCNSNASLLLNMTNPSSDKFKFIRMNPNPCYLGYCNALAMLCERDCITYKTNPYFIEELSADLPAVANDLEFYLPVKDDFNKSNFLFLPIVWAGNLLSSWTSHPSTNSNVQHPARGAKQPIVVVIANAPDNFEPVELTYLGFDNDAAEVPMYESDTILFDSGGYVKKNNKYLGVKGVINYSTTGSTIIHNILEGSSGATAAERDFMNNGYGLLYSSKGVATISFPNKGIVKVVVARNEPASVTVQNKYGVSQSGYVNKKINVTGSATLNFSGSSNFAGWGSSSYSYNADTWTTKGMNFGHNLSTQKLNFKAKWCKLRKAILSNQVLRYYGQYDASKCGNKQLILSPGKSGIWSRMDPCICGDGDYSRDTAITYNKRGWDCGYTAASDGSYIKAYQFSLRCKNIGDSSTFIMSAFDFPNKNNLFSARIGNTNEAYFSQNSSQPYLNDSIGFIFNNNYKSGNRIINNPGKYTMHYSPFNSGNIGDLIVSTGKLRYVSRLGYYTTYTAKVKKVYSGQATSTLYRIYNNSNCNSNSCCYKDRKSKDITGEECVGDWNCCNGSGNSYWDPCKSKKTIVTGKFYWNEYNTKDGCQGVARCSNPKRIKDVAGLGSNWTETQSCEEFKGCFGACKPISTYSATLNYNETVTGACIFDGRSATCKYQQESGQADQKVYNTYVYDEVNKKYGAGSISNLNCNGTVSDIVSVSQSCLYSDPPQSVSYTFYAGGGSQSVKKTESGTDGRCYDIVFFNSAGNMTGTHDTFFCDGNGYNCRNCQKDEYERDYCGFKWSNSLTLHPGGMLVDNYTQWTPYQYTIKNFFFVNSKNIEQSFSYDDKYKLTTSFNQTSVNENRSIGLKGTETLSASEDGVVSNRDFDVYFCGDGNLSLLFESYDRTSVRFKDISDETYRLQLNNQEVVNTVGTELNTFSDTQTFYIIPEQIISHKDGNYYITMELAANSRVVSVELNNRPYNTTIPELKSPSHPDLNSNKEVYIRNGTLHITTNVRSAFSYEIKSPKIDLYGNKDFRQNEGLIYLRSNTDKIPATIIAEVPSTGEAPSLSVDNTNNSCTISAGRKLESFTLSGYKKTSATFDGVDYSWTLNEIINNTSKGNSISLFHDGTVRKGWDLKSGDSYISPENCKKSYNLNLCNLNWEIQDHEIELYPESAGVRSDVNTRITVGSEWFDYAENAIRGRDNYPKVTFDFYDLYSKYGKGTLKLSGKSSFGVDAKAPSVDYSAGDSSFSRDKSDGGGWELSGTVSSQSNAKAVFQQTSAREIGSRSCGQNCSESYDRSGYNYITRIAYYPSNSRGSRSGSVSGTIYTQGSGTLKYTLTPQKLATSASFNVVGDNSTTGMATYTYSKTPGFYVSSISDYKFYYNGGELDGTWGADGSTIEKAFYPNINKGRYYERVIYVKNALVSVAGVSSGGTTSTGDYMDANQTETKTVYPSQLTLESDGLYHIRIPLGNSVVSNLRWYDSDPVKTYAHPNIKNEKLDNTRIFDGYYKKGNTFGNMSYPTANHNFTPIQRLFYWLRNDSGAAQYVDNLNEKGDFYINLWDQNDEVPSIKWYLNGAIRNADYNVNNFGNYRSNYRFSGLHRMFIPYKAYGTGRYAGFQDAWDSAVVFSGFTIPANYALLRGGYQKKGSSSYPNYSVSPTPTEAVKKLAQAACGELKKLRPTPVIYLVKYRTSAAMSLEGHVDGVVRIDNSEQLDDFLRNLAFTLKSVNSRQLNIKTSKL